jgi:hypothetical protein
MNYPNIKIIVGPVGNILRAGCGPRAANWLGVLWRKLSMYIHIASVICILCYYSTSLNSNSRFAPHILPANISYPTQWRRKTLCQLRSQSERWNRRTVHCSYICKKKGQSCFTPWRRLGGEEVWLLRIHDLGTRWGWVSVTPRPRFTPGERTPLYPF